MTAQKIARLQNEWMVSELDKRVGRNHSRAVIEAMAWEARDLEREIARLTEAWEVAVESYEAASVRAIAAEQALDALMEKGSQ